MARRTKTDRILRLEERRDQLEEMQERNESIAEIKAQGTDGASTQFVDPLRISKLLESIEIKLEMEYMSE